jgi:hypothetical protein
MQNIFFTWGGVNHRFVGGGQTDGQTDRHFFSWGSGIFISYLILFIGLPSGMAELQLVQPCTKAIAPLYLFIYYLLC